MHITIFFVILGKIDRKFDSIHIIPKAVYHAAKLRSTDACVLLSSAKDIVCTWFSIFFHNRIFLCIWFYFRKYQSKGLC